MHIIKIKTKYNTFEFIVEDYFAEEVQEIINQPYVEEVYIRCIDYEDKEQYKGVKRLVKEKKE